MVAPSRDDRSVDALVKSKAVLEVLAELGPSTAKTISERTGEPVSSTYRLLDNLVAVGWVERGINRGEYRLGIDCVRIGGQIESRLDIQQIARRTFRAHRGQFGIWGLFVRGDCARCASRHAPVRHCKAMHSWWAVACL